jgi:RimJ/RimL family protein N-acetyltransferase
VKVEPVVLEGRQVRLEPLTLDHLEGLCEVGLDPELWRWTTNQPGTREDLRGYIETALEGQRAGTTLPFATVLRSEGRVVGSTRFANIERAHRRAEIGWTFVAQAWQRTAINTEAKYLMLCHAFETLGCIRVEFKTDALNEKSRRAIRRIGAKEEGTLRSHAITDSGRVRDSVYFSIIEREWPAAKAALEALRDQPGQP